MDNKMKLIMDTLGYQSKETRIKLNSAYIKLFEDSPLLKKIGKSMLKRFRDNQALLEQELEDYIRSFDDV